MLETAEWRQVEEAIRNAVRAGVDASELLDSLGLLATKRKLNATRLNALVKFSEQLDIWQPEDILRHWDKSGGPWVPTDMLKAVKMFIEEYIEMIRSEIG